MFRLFSDIASLHRQQYTDKKSSFLPTGSSCKGYLKPLSQENGEVGLDKYGKEFAFNTSTDIDIREGDKLEISQAFYRVKGIAEKRGIGIRYKRILLVKE